MRDFRLYMLVGGMPQAVKAYIESKNMSKVNQTKRRIIRLYEKDLMKIDPSGMASKLFMAIPSELTRNASRYTVNAPTDGDGRHDRLVEIIFDMLSVTQNAPIEAFGNLSETFFYGITPDQMLTPIHLTFRFIGLTPVSSFFSSDVMKNPTILEDLERFKEHLRHYFPFEQ